MNLGLNPGSGVQPTRPRPVLLLLLSEAGFFANGIFPFPLFGASLPSSARLLVGSALSSIQAPRRERFLFLRARSAFFCSGPPGLARLRSARAGWRATAGPALSTPAGSGWTSRGAVRLAGPAARAPEPRFLPPPARRGPSRRLRPAACQARRIQAGPHCGLGAPGVPPGSAPGARSLGRDPQFGRRVSFRGRASLPGSAGPPRASGTRDPPTGAAGPRRRGRRLPPHCCPCPKDPGTEESSSGWKELQPPGSGTSRPLGYQYCRIGRW